MVRRPRSDRPVRSFGVVLLVVVSLSTASLRYLSNLLARRRAAIGCRWRKLSTSHQALLVLAHLRNGDTYSRRAAGFRVGVATVSRYAWEAVDLLAATAPALRTARAARAKAFVVLDGTLIHINRVGVKMTGSTMLASTSGTASTCNCSPTWPAGSPGPHPPCPAPPTT